MKTHPEWLTVHEGDAPLIVSFPHTGSELPHDLIGDYHSPWLARRDADWWVHELYDFVRGMGATTVRSAVSRSVIDLNRDPSGVSLYPGQNTTGLCPLTCFLETSLDGKGDPRPCSGCPILRNTRGGALSPPHHTCH